ncbi:MAG: SDR family NAD(P)-dependent oxidoreductase, partial [Albidovulum sp.]|uniref:SDR family NAD(P)-dependent oxidoreductase n=1 Tax=Albidovulum sp. TaxID=1872424 RepID=UPI003C8330A6
MADTRIAVVTGAASGIGYSIATWFARKGCRVVLADRQSPVDACAKINRDYGPE